jgi:tetratricopeptide (TPR) repeat protein
LRGVIFHLADKDHRRAIADFDKAIELGVRRGIIFRARGDAHDALGHFLPAIGDYDWALGLNDKDGESYLGRCLARASRAGPGDTDEVNKAIGDCQVAGLHLPEAHPGPFFGRALGKLKLGELHNAMQDAGAALLANPKHAPSLFLRGIIHRRSGNESAAAADFLAATAIDPDVAAELRRRGVE